MLRAHIRHSRLNGILVSPLRRVTFSRRRKSNQKGLPLASGLRCAQVPSRRFSSVGTPPRAIHGPSRLSRHPCREAHCAEPPLGLPMGRVDQDQKQIKSRRGGRPDGASVCDAIFVAADERSEAASGCVATVKPGPGIHLSEPACEGRSLAGRVDRQQSINRGHINPRATPSTGWHSAPCVCQTLPHRPPSARPAPATAATTDAGATAGQRQSGTAPG